MLFLSVLILLLTSHLSNAKYLQLDKSKSLEKDFYKLEHAEEIFKEFIEFFGKQYEDETEYGNRLKIFTENLLEVNRLNNASSNAVYGISHLHDLSQEEFHMKHAGCLGEMNYDDVEILSAKIFIGNGIAAPESLDWRQFGVVTDVKNQGHCGSCWAFSAIGAIEGQFAKKYHDLQMFSEQQLIDCNGEARCFGGWFMHSAFQYAAEAGGVISEISYPYIDGVQECLFVRDMVRAEVIDGSPVAVESEDQLKELLFRYGPLSIGIDARQWQYYQGGILTPHEHGKTVLDHGVLLVGYGKDTNGQKYWTIKNSWSKNWGEDGYVRIVRGQGAFGITQYVAVVALL